MDGFDGVNFDFSGQDTTLDGTGSIFNPQQGIPQGNVLPPEMQVGYSQPIQPQVPQQGGFLSNLFGFGQNNMQPQQMGYGNMMDYNQQQIMYNQQPRRYTRGEIIQMLQDYVSFQTKRTITKVVKIEEIPSELRHSCIHTGVTKLQQYYVDMPNSYGSCSRIPFFFCIKCGALYYCADYLQ